jgi:hypothetical protein
VKLALSGLEPDFSTVKLAETALLDTFLHVKELDRATLLAFLIAND